MEAAFGQLARWPAQRLIMPLTPKGRKIKAEMVKRYGRPKGEQVFHASKNKGRITGVDKPSGSKKGKGSSAKGKRKK